MLCTLCETFLTNILDEELATWRRVEEGWFTFKHGNYATITASALGGCELCALFNRVRCESISNYEGLNEKWHVQGASIDVKHEYQLDSNGNKGSTSVLHLNRTFQLLTAAPEKSWIAFEIFQPHSQETSSTELNVASLDWPQDVATSSVSPKSIGIAKRWIETCLNGHPACTRLDRAPLPTRVIDVGTSDGSPKPRLQVNRGQLGWYVTLSHCWGAGERVKLTKRNLAAFERSIPYDQLPKTFQDAIQITMLLGVRYLWIDALCIVQDDQTDWRRGSASMCAVYENALFSISAISATDSHSGMLQERASRQITTKINGAQLGVRRKLDSLPEAMTKSQLENRAWCLQERLLPPSILHVGPAQIYWECRTCTASEAFPTYDAPKQLGRETLSSLTSHNLDRISRDDFASEWLRLVSNYSARKVTRASDRLPAIAGLADKVRKELGTVAYMQGSWSDTLHRELLWKRRSLTNGKNIPSRDKYFSRPSTGAAERPRHPIASSWSWASINDAVEYPTYTDYRFRSHEKSDVVFGSCEATENDLLPLSEGVLRIEGLIKSGSCKLSSNPPDETHASTFRPSGSLLIDNGLKCFLDYVDDPVSKTCYCLRVANWRQVPARARKKSRSSDDLQKVFYLVLERVQQDSPNRPDGDIFGSFKRIGMGFDAPDKADKVFANVETRQLRLL